MSSIFNGIEDLLKLPVTMWDRREGHPFVQGVARNIGHASFGNRIGDMVDTHLLGDPAGPSTPAPVAPPPQIDSGLANEQAVMQALMAHLADKNPTPLF